MPTVKIQISDLSDDAFAIKAKRLLPLHDREHILMAANAINSVKGVTDEQRIEGRIAIAVAADRHGLDVKAAKKMHLRFESMAIEMPSLPDHPNRHPFSGILTRLDIASDFPVGGTTSKKVVIPLPVAEQALSTLLGMAIGFREDFKGHDRKAKIGLITEAFIGEVDSVLGTPLHIAGFFYAADFPQEVDFIQTERDVLGFSYEAEAFVESMNSDPWICASCKFTGAAVLYKDKAAFAQTSIHASQHPGDTNMQLTPKEIEDLQAQAATLTAENAALLAANTALKAASDALLVQASSVQAFVKPHATALRAAAAAMLAAGIGADATNGHAVYLNKMADKMEAQALLGQIPSSVESYFYASSADSEKMVVQAAAYKDEIASLNTKLSDAVAKASSLEAGSSTRKTLSAANVATLRKIGLGDVETDKLSVADVDQACQKAGLRSTDSMALKMNLRASGALA